MRRPIVNGKLIPEIDRRRPIDRAAWELTERGKPGIGAFAMATRRGSRENFAISMLRSGQRRQYPVEDEVNATIERLRDEKAAEGENDKDPRPLDEA
ncbi:MAG TPA: hypothetical protein VGG62_07050 [Terracidiphilus sp.]